MKHLLTFISILGCGTCLAQNAPFKSLRYDENYSYLARDTAADWYSRLKFNPLSKDKTVYLSIGGEARYQYFHFTNQDWGEAPTDKDGFILSRFLGHADLHVGKNFRTFVQLQSSLADGEAEIPSAVDQNPLELHQGFMDYLLYAKPQGSLTFRVGRQELSYGSQRLVAVREAPNNRQSFDGAKLFYGSKQLKFDLFYSYYVPAKPNFFDDALNKGTKFWGAYAVINKVPLLQNVDIYFLGINKRTAVFDDGKGAETRHSLGARIWANSPALQYDIEGLYQFGKFADGDISAWTLSANISYGFEHAKLKPRIGFKTEAISGDRNRGDGRLNTFNPLFPKGAYFGLAALIGPYNLLDMHPYLELSISRKLLFSADYDLFWRMNKNDGLYAVNGRLLYSSKDGEAKKIGGQLGGELNYSASKYLSLRQELTWFMAGNYLKQAGPGKDILMTGTTLTLKF